MEVTITTARADVPNFQATINSDSILSSDDRLRMIRSSSNMYPQRNGQVAYVFTWKTSPVHEAVFGAGGVRLYTMTTRVSYTVQVGKTNESMVPQDDKAVLLEEMRKLAESQPPQRMLFIFDGISDVMVLSGLESTYDFIRKMNEPVAPPPPALELATVVQNDIGRTSFQVWPVLLCAVSSWGIP